MSKTSRRIRRWGAVALLFAWAQVATANAVPCAIWCHLNGGAAAHTMASVHGGHNHGGVPQHDCGASVSNGDCSTPQLLVVAAVTPDVLVVPPSPISIADPVVASPATIITSYPGFDTPPPRA